MSRRTIDIAAFAGETYDDAWQAMAESYAEVGTILVALLQQVGPITLPPEAFDRARGHVAYFEPIGRGGAFRCVAIPREEGDVDPEAVERLRAKWERQYIRRPPR
jgi:hypothetical protein